MEFKTTPFAHQLDEFELSRDMEARGIFWEMGCVSGDTEYLTPTGWRPFASYDGESMVAQWDPETGRASFVVPLRYVTERAERVVHLWNARGLSQILSMNHRVVHLQKRTLKPCWTTAGEMADVLLASGKSTARRLPVKFILEHDGRGTGLSERELRLQIAVMADGHFPAGCSTTRCTMRLKKARKITRLRMLLEGREFNERFEETTGFTIFRFNAPLRQKRWPWYDTLAWERRVIVDEVWRWDGSAEKDGRGWQFFSKHQSDAEFVQFVAAAEGLVASTSYDGRGCWSVRVRGTYTDGYLVRGENVQILEGPRNVYCFQVPSGALVCRRNGSIFLTGNCGKSKPVIDSIAHLYEAGEITGVVVLAPNGVHRNWAKDEIPTHMPDAVAEKTRVLHWMTSKAQNKGARDEAAAALRHEGLLIVCMSYNGIMTEPGAKFIRKVVDDRRCMGILDESPYIKTPGAKRTKRVLALARHLPYRRILTGTVVDDKPFDVYAQLKFLDEKAWHDVGCADFAAFKATFGVWQTRVLGNGRQFPELVNFRNLPKLNEVVSRYGSRLLKENVLDLPPKLYSKRYFEMSPAQWKAYRELRDEMLTWVDGQPITAAMAITMRLRLQQITSGYLPTEDPDTEDQRLVPIGDKNPRIDLLLDVLDEADGQQVIVWAKYRYDIDHILERLREAGVSAVRYDGQCSEAEAGAAVDAFKAGDARVFVANPAKGAEGITLTCAKTVVYFNNSYKLSKRLQSEDRAHRIGQEHPVQVIDLCAEDTVDIQIVDALRNKYEMAAIVQGDELRDWI